jgi:hypothetical protein
VKHSSFDESCPHVEISHDVDRREQYQLLESCFLEQDIEGMDSNQSCELWQGVLYRKEIISKLINSIKLSTLTFLDSRLNM